MNVLIDGFGVHDSGIAAALYFRSRKYNVSIAGQSNQNKDSVKVIMLDSLKIKTILHPIRKEDVEKADLIVKVKGGIVNEAINNCGKPTTTDFQWFFSSPVVNSIKNIVVTGSKGKSRTAAKIVHILNASGHCATSCGNMGLSPFTLLSELEKKVENNEPLPEYNVCEISTWQLLSAVPAEMKDKRQKFTALVITDLFAEDFSDDEITKLTWLEKYFKTVLTDKATLEPVCKLLGCKETRVSVAEKKVTVSDANLIAKALAAILGLRQKQINSAILTYRGVPHRSEFVCNSGNILFVNDSAANVPEAVSFSFLNLRPLKVHLICGGSDDLSLEAERMLPALKEAVSVHLLDGSFTRKKLIPLLKKENISFTGPFLSVEDSVNEAYAAATTDKISDKGELQAVLLSPGAKTYELFDDEFERGSVFRDYVLKRFS